jgi:hypothetical protein
MIEPNPAGRRYCATCGTGWTASAVNPQSYVDHLAGMVELATARLVLPRLIALADSSAVLSDAELDERLSMLVPPSSLPERR